MTNHIKSKDNDGNYSCNNCKLINVSELFASSETDVAGLAQLKKEASISEITFIC